MFNNIGKKIKILAKVLCWIGIIASIIGGFVFFAIDEDLIPIGLGVMILGSFLSWIGSFFTYGFGELIDKADQIEKNTHSHITNTPPAHSSLDELKKLREEGLITDEEYNHTISKHSNEVQ